MLILTASATTLAQTSPPTVQGDSAAATTLFEMFFLSADPFGIAIIWLLLMMSFASIGLMMYFARRYRRARLLPTGLDDELRQLLLDRQYKQAIERANEDGSFLGKVTAAALHESANGYDAMERAIEDSGDAQAARLLRPIEILNVLGNIAPMIGLFGTVYGMIVAFQKLQQVGQPDPAQLAGGISTALVTTFWGLVVAIPALAGYALIRNNLDAHTSESLIIAEELIKPFRPDAQTRTTTNEQPPTSS